MGLEVSDLRIAMLPNLTSLYPPYLDRIYREVNVWTQ